MLLCRPPSAETALHQVPRGLVSPRRVQGLLQARPTRVPSPCRRRPRGLQRSACTPAALCLLCLMTRCICCFGLHSTGAASWLPPLSRQIQVHCWLLSFCSEVCSCRHLSADVLHCTAQQGRLPHHVSSMPEQRYFHMQGKAAQTKRGPAPRAVAPVKVNAKPAVRQSSTSTGAVQVGHRAVRQWCFCMPSGFITPAMHCLERSHPGEDVARNASACRHSKQLSCAPF